MENKFLDKVEDNAAVRVWSEKTQSEKGDSLAKGYTSELWDYTRISVTQNNLQDLKVDVHLFRAIAQFWNPAYDCFTFGGADLVPTIEEYIALLRCPKIQVDKIYSRAVNVPTFIKKLMNITGMSKQWVTARIKQKGESKLIFPKALGHVDEATSDLFDRLDKRVTPVPAILAETFRSLNACQKAGEGRFIGCVQLLLAWFHSHFWKIDKVSYRVFSEYYSPSKEIAATPRRDDISEEKWLLILQNLREEDVEWRAPWLFSDEILYRCGNFDWVPLLGIWGVVGYALLLVLRQYRSRYKKKIREITRAWDQTRRMKRLAVGPTTPLEYNEWWVRRINDDIPRSSQGDSQSIEEHLRVIPSELEIVKRDFEKRNAELEKKIEQLEEKKMHLGLDVDIQKLETEKLRKGKNTAEEELDSLKTDYKKLRLSIRTVGLGKTSEQWRQEIREEKVKADGWEKKF
ncbi:uncharacterized protein LOC105784843 [Gossypium raimondii]|uniref:uncharacterized protein LOC105784843 n=1 Tax=Gossypium raimondii TaxID=29730 RepID=UPI00063A9240|nr:uncharacterized protein LOC105784843 [Gossypium raimondii]